METPTLTDRAALTRQRLRASRMPEPAMFLHEDVFHEIEERLSEVNRRFTSPAVVTGFPEFWQQSVPDAVVVPDDEVLALRPRSHDLVIHALCLHWANDPVGQLVQCRHALKPDGLLIAVLFAGGTLRELRAVLAEAETEATGGLSPRVVPMGDIRDLGALLQRAGLALPVADSAVRRVEYRDALHLMRDLRAMGEGNALAGRSRRFLRRRIVADAAARYASAYGTAEGRIPATFETVMLTGWAPDESQQKPLRPGSAISRLADALGTPETPLPRSQQDARTTQDARTPQDD